MFGDVLLRLVRYRRQGAIVAAVIVVVLAAMIRAPAFEGSLVEEMSQDLPELIAAQTIADARGNVETSIVVVTADPAATITEVFDELAGLEAAVTAALPGAAIESLRRFEPQLFLMGLGRNDDFSALLVKLRLDPQTKFMISARSDRFLVVVSSPVDAQTALYEAVEALPPGRALTERRALAGARLSEDVANSLRQDLRVLIPLIMFVLMIVLLLAFGHWRALLLPAFSSLCSAIVVFCLLTAGAVNINLVTLLALPIVLVVSIANSCHFLAKSAVARVNDDDTDGAIMATLARVSAPYLISSLTTAIALASLGVSGIGPIASLGIVSAVALVVTFAVVMLAAPFAIGVYLAVPAQTVATSRAYRALSRRTAELRKPISLLLILISIGGALTIPGLSLQSDPRNLFPDDTEFTQTFHLFESEFYNFAPLRILLEARNGTGLAAVFEQAGALRSRLAAFDGVRGVRLDPAQNREAALLLTVMIETTAQQRAIDTFLQDYRQEVGAAYDIVHSSAAIVYRSIDERALSALFRSLGWSVLLILATLIVVFHSARKLFAAVVANVVPLALICAVAWLMSAPLNVVTAFVFLVVLGIIVDDTIHVLFWERSGDPIAGSSIEFSVIWSTVLLFIGLSLWQVSDFPTTRTFAAYCSLALVGAVVSDLTLLPWLLRAAPRRRDSQP